MDLREQLSRILESSKMGFSVEVLSSSVGLSKKLISGKYHALIVDYDLSIGDVPALLKTAKEVDPFLPTVLISRDFADRINTEATRMGADAYFPLTGVVLKMFPRILMKNIVNSSFVREAIDARHQSTLKSYQLEILASLVRKMVETNDLHSVMQEMAEQVVKKLDMKVVSLQRFLQRENGFTVHGIYPQGKLVKLAQKFFGISLDSFVFPFEPQNCVVDQYTAERKPWVGTDFADVFGTTMPSQAARLIQKFAGVKSIYNAPFYNKDELLGGMLVGNVRESFTDEELEAFDAIVHISSLLFEYNESVKQQIIQNQKLAAIHETSFQLHENLELGKLFDIIHKKLDELIPSDVVRLFLYDERLQLLREEKAVLRKRKRPDFIAVEVPIGKGLIGRAAAEVKPVLENNAHLNPLSIYPSEKPALEHLLAAPITYRGQLLGMIALTRLKNVPFKEPDLYALEIFTSQLATALYNSRLYDDLSRSESLYRLVLQNVNDPVVLIGTDRLILYVNPKFEDITGYKSEEVLGHEFDILVYPEDLPKVNGYYAKRMSGGDVPSRYEFRFLRKSGEIGITEYNVATILEDGKVTGLLGVARDVTDDRIADENLKLKTQQLQKLLDISASLMHSGSLDELLEMLITSARDAVPEADAGVVLIYSKTENRLRVTASIGYSKEMKEKFAIAPGEGWGGRVFTTCTPAIIEDATSYPSLSVMSELPEAGKAKSAIAAPLLVDNEALGVVSLDSFQKKGAFTREQLHFLEGIAHQAALAIRKERILAELKESESRYRTITDSSSDVIVITDGSGKIEFSNLRFSLTFGLKNRLSIGRKIFDFFDESSFGPLVKVLLVGDGGKTSRVTATIDGLCHYFDVVSSAIGIDHGTDKRILFLNDVSDIVRTNDWLEKAYEVGVKRSGGELFEDYASLLSERL